MARCRKGSVVIFDEAGMAPTRSSARLLQAARLAGVKVIVIGDPGQLASVRAGGWLAGTGARVGALRLGEVMRQRDPAERRMLAALHDGRPAQYLNWADKAGRITTFAEAREARAQAVTEWNEAARRAGPKEVVMIARDNQTRTALNVAARELWRALGQLGEEQTFGRLTLAVGDRVICRRNDALIDVDNGSRGTVRRVDRARVVIEVDSGLVRELPASYAREHVEHAYALTAHGMQGGTVDHAVVVASPRELTGGWSYTALSRARMNTDLLVHAEQRVDDRPGFAPGEHAASASRAELLEHVQRRMLEREAEDLAIEQLQVARRADGPRLAASGRVEEAYARSRSFAATELSDERAEPGLSRRKAKGARVLGR